MPEDKVIENSLNKEAHDAGLGRYVLILIIIFVLLWAINAYYSSQKQDPPLPETGQPINQETVPANNQAEQAQAERTSDVFTYNSAIEKRDKKLCERITDESLKSDCFKFFRVNGL